MDTRWNAEIRIRQANMQSFLGVYGDVVSPAHAQERRAVQPPLHERFRTQPAVSQYTASLGTRGVSFPARMLSAVQENISRNPGRALESQGNLSAHNVSALLEL